MAPEITNTEVNFIWNGIKIVTSVVINFERTPVATNEYGRNAQAPIVVVTFWNACSMVQLSGETKGTSIKGTSIPNARD